MAQVDVVTYSVIIFWTFIIFGLSYITYTLFVFKCFIVYIKSLSKLSTLFFFKMIFALYNVRVSEQIFVGQFFNKTLMAINNIQF